MSSEANLSHASDEATIHITTQLFADETATPPFKFKVTVGFPQVVEEHTRESVEDEVDILRYYLVKSCDEATDALDHWNDFGFARRIFSEASNSAKVMFVEYYLPRLIQDHGSVPFHWPQQDTAPATDQATASTTTVAEESSEDHTIPERLEGSAMDHRSLVYRPSGSSSRAPE